MNASHASADFNKNRLSLFCIYGTPAGVIVIISSMCSDNSNEVYRLTDLSSMLYVYRSKQKGVVDSPTIRERKCSVLNLPRSERK